MGSDTIDPVITEIITTVSVSVLKTQLLYEKSVQKSQCKKYVHLMVLEAVS